MDKRLEWYHSGVPLKTLPVSNCLSVSHISIGINRSQIFIDFRCRDYSPAHVGYVIGEREHSGSLMETGHTLFQWKALVSTHCHESE